MDIQTVTPELLTNAVVSYILTDWSTVPPTPDVAITTILFKGSAFYDLYGNHWDSFVDLRKEVSNALIDPAHLKLVNNEIVFNLNSNEVSPESLGILKVFLTQCGWDSFTVHCTGYVNFLYRGTMGSKSCYEFRLTNKRAK